MVNAVPGSYGGESAFAEADRLSPFRKRVLDSARCIFWQICSKNEEDKASNPLVLELKQLTRCIGVSSTMIMDGLSSLGDAGFLTARRATISQSVGYGRKAMFGPTEKLKALGFAIGPRCATEQPFQSASEVTPLQSYVGFCLLCKEGTIAKIQSCVGGAPSSIRSAVQKLASRELVEVEEMPNGRSYVYRHTDMGRHFFRLLPEAQEWQGKRQCGRHAWLSSVRPSSQGSDEQTTNQGKSEAAVPATPPPPTLYPDELVPQLRRIASLISPTATEHTLAQACPDLLDFTAPQLAGLANHLHAILEGEVESQEIRDPSIRDLIIWMRAQKQQPESHPRG